MNKKIFLIIFSVFAAALVFGGFFFYNKAKCFAASGAIHLPQLTEVGQGQPIVLTFKLLRVAAVSCYKGLASDSYKNLMCGYRLQDSQIWGSGTLIVKKDTETEYEVECQIAPIFQSIKLEYFLEYSAWGNSPERKNGILLVK